MLRDISRASGPAVGSAINRPFDRVVNECMLIRGVRIVKVRLVVYGKEHEA